MRFLRNLFKQNKDIQDPVIQFGRFTDTYKSDKNYEAWEKSLFAFDQEKYLDSLRHFFDFLNDDRIGNVRYHILPGKIQFIIYQGSKIINGEADQFTLKAEAKIAKSDTYELGWLRMLSEENYDLKYCRYALDEFENITLVFDTYVEDGSPHKLYQALKELATIADKKDDILIAEFKSLKSINFYHTRQISIKEKQIKYDFFNHSVKEVITELESGKLNISQIPGGMSYLLLNLVYKMDYLIKPEGLIMECIEHCNDIFFGNNTLSVDQKNNQILRQLKDSFEISQEQFFKELYEVKSTFGVALPSGHERLKELIDAQINDMDWYQENGHHSYAMAISGYIVGYALFSYALPEPSKALLHMYYRLMDEGYFKALGFNQQFEKNGKPDKKQVRIKLRAMVEEYRSDYPEINLQYELLDFSDYTTFAKSYLYMIRELSISENL